MRSETKIYTSYKSLGYKKREFYTEHQLEQEEKYRQELKEMKENSLDEEKSYLHNLKETQREEIRLQMEDEKLEIHRCCWYRDICSEFEDDFEKILAFVELHCEKKMLEKENKQVPLELNDKIKSEANSIKKLCKWHSMPFDKLLKLEMEDLDYYLRYEKRKRRRRK